MPKEVDKNKNLEKLFDMVARFSEQEQEKLVAMLTGYEYFKATLAPTATN
ncbi:MAG: hypothetical protein FWG64_02780 [Firmicutes bacterium]|nr:hypothetical protein [Bacillota bacterium]